MLKFGFTAALLAAASLYAHSAEARDQIRIVGSSTVYPFAASVAEHFGRVGDFRTPVVEATGTGAGIKLFCEGVGEALPDVATASRPMLPGERERCQKQGVTSPVEIKIGFDGITFANSAKAERAKFSRKDIFLALARELPDAAGKMVPNPHKTWKEVNPALPDSPIRVYGMPPVSGTRDTFVELVMEKGCAEVPRIAELIPDEKKHKHFCKVIREDGAFIEAGENGNLIVQKLLGDEEAFGLLGFSFLDQNTGVIQASFIEGVEPSFDTIQNATYPISRPLYIYVKGDHVGLIAGLREYAQEFLSEGTAGDEGYLVNKGIIPLPAEERAQIRTSVLQALAAMHHKTPPAALDPAR